MERQKHLQMYPHWNARDNYRFGIKKKKRKRDRTDDPGRHIFSSKTRLIPSFSLSSLFITWCHLAEYWRTHSGMRWQKASSRNITRWLDERGVCTWNFTQTGLPGRITPRAKRKERKRTKLGMTAVMVKAKLLSEKGCVLKNIQGRVGFNIISWILVESFSGNGDCKGIGDIA